MTGRILLDERLRAVADMVRPGGVVADIGTDHGYLACALVLEGKAPRAYAADKNEKPLARARKTIEQYGLTGRVDPILSDGLSAFEGTELRDIVIAGMGGEQIAAILEGAAWTRDRSLSFTLQPMTRPEQLRHRLYAEGFGILEERAVVSGAFAYAVMRAEYTGECRDIPPLLAWTGKIWDNKDEASRAYLRRALHRLTRMAGGMERGANGDTAELRRLCEQIEGRLREDD